MVITPDSKVKLIKNPLKLDSNNEITFTNATSQYNYFNSLPKLEFDNLTYIRKDNILRIETDENLTFEDLLEYNFCMYQNTHFDNKWFYAFITDITWINPGLTELKLETAYFQTWQFDLVYMDSFIEREHVNDDAIGLHTIPENLETGEVINYSVTKSNIIRGNIKNFICIAVTEDLMNNTNTTRLLFKVPNGLTYIIPQTAQDLDNIIKLYQGAGKGDAIYSIFVVPSLLVAGINEPLNWQTYTVPLIGTTISYLYYPTHSEPVSLDNVTINRISTINGYTPKNNKLLTYPYIYLMTDNNCGSAYTYRFEEFYNGTAEFNISGVLSIGCEIKVIPYKYKLDTYNFSESFNGGKYPLGSWINDPYINWLTQTGVNREANIIKSIGTGAAAGTLGGLGVGIAGAIAGGINGIWNDMNEKQSHDIIPEQIQGNVNSSNYMFSEDNNNEIYFYVKTIKQEYAKSIDGYFNMFGYKVNRLGKPHIKARTYYDYIKTIDVNIEGNIPENDLNQIRKMFNDGIRFWHNTTYYLDFSVNNTIVS